MPYPNPYQCLDPCRCFLRKEHHPSMCHLRFTFIIIWLLNYMIICFHNYLICSIIKGYLASRRFKMDFFFGWVRFVTSFCYWILIFTWVEVFLSLFIFLLNWVEVFLRVRNFTLGSVTRSNISKIAVFERTWSSIGYTLKIEAIKLLCPSSLPLLMGRTYICIFNKFRKRHCYVITIYSWYCSETPEIILFMPF